MNVYSKDHTTAFKSRKYNPSCVHSDAREQSAQGFLQSFHGKFLKIRLNVTIVDSLSKHIRYNGSDDVRFATFALIAGGRFVVIVVWLVEWQCVSTCRLCVRRLLLDDGRSEDTAVRPYVLRGVCRQVDAQ